MANRVTRHLKKRTGQINSEVKKIKASAIFIQIKCYFMITLGLLCYVLGWDIFLIPNNLVGGGVTGIAAILFYSLRIPISISFGAINCFLLLLGLKFLGKGFGFKTIFAVAITTLFFQFVPNFIPQDFINEIAISNGRLISAIFGGIMTGIGIGLCFANGGSTGGTDIIALIVAKYHDIAPGRMILYMDIVIILSSLLIPAEEISFGTRLATVLYAFMITGTYSYIVDMMMAGRQQSLQVYLFSREYEKIADAITDKLGRGVSIFTGEGWYTKSEIKMLIVVVHKTQVALLRNIIREVDPNAFISMSPVSSVYGRGFKGLSKK